MLAVLLLLSVSTFSHANTDVLVGDYPANITRTAWEMKRSDSVQTLGFNLFSLEDTDAYILADIPDDDESWEHATDTSIIGFKERSRITGTDGNNGCKSAVDYTYFQTYINIPAGVEVTDFSINFPDYVQSSAGSSGEPVGGAYYTCSFLCRSISCHVISFSFSQAFHYPNLLSFTVLKASVNQHWKLLAGQAVFIARIAVILATVRITVPAESSFNAIDVDTKPA